LHWSSAELTQRLDEMLGGMATSQQFCHGDADGRRAFLQFVCTMAHTRCPAGAKEGQTIVYRETTRLCQSSCEMLRDAYYSGVTRFFSTSSVAREFLQTSLNKTMPSANDRAVKLIPLVCQAEFPLDCANSEFISSDSATCTSSLPFAATPPTPYAGVADCLARQRAAKQCDFARDFVSSLDVAAPLCDQSMSSSKRLQLRLQTENVAITLRAPNIIDSSRNIHWYECSFDYG
jgi:hypothetical protein